MEVQILSRAQHKKDKPFGLVGFFNASHWVEDTLRVQHAVLQAGLRGSDDAALTYSRVFGIRVDGCVDAAPRKNFLSLSAGNFLH